MRKERMKFKEGQTYICTKSSLTWFTEGKEYPVIVTDFGKLAIQDNDGTTWFDYELTGLSTCFKLKGEKEVEFKVGDKVYGKNRHNDDWITGEIIHVSNQSGYLIEPSTAEYQFAWLETDTVKLLLEETPDPNATKEESTSYTKSEINQQISIAYQNFDNDSQRLAYLQGYFAK